MRATNGQARFIRAFQATKFLDRIVKVGEKGTAFKVGGIAAVGCLVRLLSASCELRGRAWCRESDGSRESARLNTSARVTFSATVVK
jgi:hypothetical protein